MVIGSQPSSNIYFQPGRGNHQQNQRTLLGSNRARQIGSSAIFIELQESLLRTRSENRTVLNAFREEVGALHEQIGVEENELVRVRGINNRMMEQNAQLMEELLQLRIRNEEIEEDSPKRGMSKILVDCMPCSVMGEDGNQCSVCLAQMAKGDEVCHLKCTHSFHSDCLKPWALQQRTCPLCRQLIQLKN